MDMGLRPTERYQACVILRARKDLENRCLAKIKLKIWILDLGDSSAAGKKKGGRKTGLRRTGIPATCEARTDYWAGIYYFPWVA